MSDTLQHTLLESPQYPDFVTDCRQLIDDEVAGKDGASGMTVKTAYKMVQKLKPGIIDDSVKALLPAMTARLEPFYEQYRRQPEGSLGDYFGARQDEISEALLGVTDSRAESSNRPAIKKAYGMIRPQGKKHVGIALPRLGEIIAKHAG